MHVGPFMVLRSLSFRRSLPPVSLTSCLSFFVSIYLVFSALVIPLEPAQAQSTFNALQQEALKRGCKKFYDEFKKKDEYQNCTQGRSGRTKDSLIDGCFALYHETPKDLRSCLGKYANTIRDLTP